MSSQALARLEAQLERLVEETVSGFFGRGISPHDLALMLARQMLIDSGPEAPPYSGHILTLHLSPEDCDRLMSRHPDVEAMLTGYLAEYRSRTGHLGGSPPQVRVAADTTLIRGEMHVVTSQLLPDRAATSALEPVKSPIAAGPPGAHLLHEDGQALLLEDALVTLGRAADNSYPVSDPHVSRYHAQLRLRFGAYTLFDVGSQTGTFVNDVRVTEHRLNSGDVIRLGRTRLIYLDDSDLSATQSALPAD